MIVIFWWLDWHSLTTHPDTKELKEMCTGFWQRILPAALTQTNALFMFRATYRKAELYLYLNMLAYKGELEKTATFKEKVRQRPTM